MIASQAVIAAEVVNVLYAQSKQTIVEKSYTLQQPLANLVAYVIMQVEAAHLWTIGKVVALQTRWRQETQVSHLLQLRMPLLLT